MKLPPLYCHTPFFAALSRVKGEHASKGKGKGVGKAEG
jgi:hypothetical protein